MTSTVWLMAVPLAKMTSSRRTLKKTFLIFSAIQSGHVQILENVTLPTLEQLKAEQALEEVQSFGVTLQQTEPTTK